MVDEEYGENKGSSCAELEISVGWLSSREEESKTYFVSGSIENVLYVLMNKIPYDVNDIYIQSDIIRNCQKR